MIVEICANSYQSALNAQVAGANRIELCSELAIGGITPSYGLIKKVIAELTLPVFVLIRPRSGNFTYSKEEFEVMKANIEMCKELGCQGIVSGVLHSDNTIDIKRTQELVELAKPLPFTFHRAFDWTPNPSISLHELIEIGVSRILTSGHENSAEKGISLLQELKKQANGKLSILPGGGINSTNGIVFQKAGFDEIHGSFTTVKTANPEPEISMNSSSHFSETISVISDVDKIKTLIKSIENED